MADVKFSGFTSGSAIGAADIFVGLQGGVNVKWTGTQLLTFTHGVTGLTTNRIPYASSATVLADDAAMTWDNTNKVPTFNNVRIINKTPTGFFVGPAAGILTSFATSSGSNTGFGVSVLTSLVNGTLGQSSYNTAGGYQSMVQMTTGFSNTAWGYGTMYGATTDDNSVAIGYQALLTASGASMNTAVGALALKFLTTGIYNVAVGTSAGAAIGIGQRNTVMGWNAGAGITSGSYNVSIGNESGEYLVAGSRNTFVGAYAGTFVAGGGYNTLIGDESGDNNLTSGSYNTYIGALTEQTPGTQFDYSTAIGQAAIVTSSMSMVFGSTGATRPNYGFGGQSYGGGFGVMYLADYSTVPSAAPTGGYFWYSDAGIAKLWVAGAAAPFTFNTTSVNTILVNNVTSGGTVSVIADYSSLTIYATDAAAIRNNIFRLTEKVLKLETLLRNIGVAVN